MADENGAKLIPGINCLPGDPRLPPAAPAEPSAAETSKTAAQKEVEALKVELAAKDKDMEELRSELRVAKYSLQQIEAEFKTFSSLTGKKRRRRRKKKGKSRKGKKRTSGTPTPDVKGGEEEEEEEEEEVSYESLAEQFPKLTVRELLAAEKAFHAADLDGNGTVDTAELDKFLMANNEVYSDRQVKEIFKEMDVDGDEQIDFAEFVTVQQMIRHPEDDNAEDQKAMSRTGRAALASVRRQESQTCAVM